MTISPIRPTGRPLETGGGPPYDEGMEARLTKLETKWETVIPTLATKTDVAHGTSDVIKWVAALIFAAVAIVVATTAFMLSRIPAQAAPAPIVIYQQPSTAPPPPAASHPR